MNKERGSIKITPLWYTIVIFLVLLVASVLAYLGAFPVIIKKIPYYDSIGHFFLFGILAFSLDNALRKRMVTAAKLSMPLGALVVAFYAVIDEGLQFFSSVRSFDLRDLLFSLLGILIITTLGRFR
jgi:VanZ family protein